MQFILYNSPSFLSVEQPSSLPLQTHLNRLDMYNHSSQTPSSWYLIKNTHNQGNKQTLSVQFSPTIRRKLCECSS